MRHNLEVAMMYFCERLVYDIYPLLGVFISACFEEQLHNGDMAVSVTTHVAEGGGYSE